MTKKISYNTKSPEELTVELGKLRTAQQAFGMKVGAKDIAGYRKDRKNIARILTAMNSSTNEQK
jgi:ribosomal protein L29